MRYYSQTLFACVAFLAACGGQNQNTSTSSSIDEQSSSAISSSTKSSSSSSSQSSEAMSVFPDSVESPRIMIVGDSISAGPGCYKKYLNSKLQASGITHYQFVGEYNDDCGGGIKHSAVSCATANNFTQNSFTLPNCFGQTSFPGIAQLMSRHQPDLVMLQLGVNDVWGGSTPVSQVLNSYQSLIAQMRNQNPNIVVMVAQIHKIITSECQNQASYQNAQKLVEAVPAWAEGLSRANSPILVADLWTNSKTEEADDCVHPNDQGAMRMAENWYQALVDILW